MSKVEEKVGRIFGLKASEIYSKGQKKARSEARGLLCSWAVREFGYRLTDLARKLGLTQPAISVAVKRGVELIREHHYSLED